MTQSKGTAARLPTVPKFSVLILCCVAANLINVLANMRFHRGGASNLLRMPSGSGVCDQITGGWTDTEFKG